MSLHKFQKTNSAGTCHYLECINPKKLYTIRDVFDSSIVYQEKSLNSVLLTGPNFSNNLYRVLLRFHRDRMAVIADIEQMFYSSYV